MYPTERQIMYRLQKMLVLCLAVVAVLVALSSCDITKASLVVPEFESPVEALQWVYRNIEYIEDKSGGYIEYWQSPEQTLYYRSGDCEDMAILLADILYEQFGHTPILRIVYIKQYNGFHMNLYSDGYYYESTAGWRMMSKPGYEKLTMQWVYKGGR